MSQWWFASENFTNGFSELKSPAKADSENRYYRDAQKLSITAEKAWIKDNMDHLFNKDNDVIIASKYQIGSRRIVDKVHYLKKNYPKKKAIGPLFHPNIYATNDFKESNEAIILQIRVYDEDGLSNKEIETIQSSLSGVGTATSIAFPALAPIAGLATGVGNSLVSLVDTLNNHDRIIDGTIRLDINKPDNQGYDHLQPGFLICFGDDINGKEIYLGEDKQIYSGSNEKRPYEGSSYIIIRVRRAFLESPDYEIDEHSATLLTEIQNGKNGKSAKAISFVRETIDSYTKFKKLKRVKELKSKDTLTNDEQELLDELITDNTISDFIN